MPECAICEKAATEHCEDCGNDFCPECLEAHEHCPNCSGQGEYQYAVLRDADGNLDYLHGKPTGESGTAICRRCDQTGIV